MSLRRWFIGCALAALGVQEISALACTGSIYVQPPSEWDSLYIMVAGAFYPVPSGDREGSWYRLRAEDYGSSYYDRFLFTGADAEFYKTVNREGWITALDASSSYLNCKDLASGELFISKDSITGGTRLSATPPSEKVLYFLPPPAKAWSHSEAWALFADGSKRKLAMDTTRCGWFKLRFLDEVPSQGLRISPDSLGTVSVETGDLKARFVQGNVLAWKSVLAEAGWASGAPLVKGACKQEHSATFYDTDASLHGAFSCDAYPLPASNACYTAGVSWPSLDSKIPCIGVTPGIVSSVLSASGKPSYQAASACFESTEKFNQLFASTPGVNEVTDGKLSLHLASDGYWTFDTMEEPDQGFFPLESAPASGVGTKRQAYGGMRYGTGYKDYWSAAAKAMNVSNWGFLDQASGLPYVDLYPTAAGEFASGSLPDIYDGMYWEMRKGQSGTVGSESYTKDNPMLKNQHYCMEMRASFVYNGGERFHVRGDDDIWVYMDKRLVIDLGGMHLAAPGYVLLDTMDLVQGNRYPLDFFFCDRRTSMSNLRIKTDLLLEAPDAGVEGTRPVAASNSDVSWESAVRANGGTLALRDLQGRLLWSVVLPVEVSSVREKVSSHGGLCLLQVSSRAWLMK